MYTKSWPREAPRNKGFPFMLRLAGASFPEAIHGYNETTKEIRMFKGYATIKLIRAVNATQSAPLNAACVDDVIPYGYEAIITDVMGRQTVRVISTAELERDWCKLRMNGDQFAKLSSGECKPISEEEYERLNI
jgi:hypothetical protein